ncbi:MAG: hypothetical protein MI717_06915 [Spirochaetales bacterium]|nr:hypothetical protein [Spirochaetales bacterium]
MTKELFSSPSALYASLVDIAFMGISMAMMYNVFQVSYTSPKMVNIIVFSLLHAVNVLGGAPPISVGIQLILTLPKISGMVTTIQPFLVPASVLAEIIIGIILWIRLPKAFSKK